METRIALAACVVLGSTLCGKALSDSARRRANGLSALAEGLGVLRIRMTGMLEPVQNALTHADCPLLSMVADGMRSGVGADEAWRAVKPRAFRRGGAADSFTEQDTRVLEHLFAHLGQSGREEQEALLDSAIQDIGRLRDSARAKASEADRLYMTLGLLIGLMLALIVI